jgi:hypothetical protein
VRAEASCLDLLAGPPGCSPLPRDGDHVLCCSWGVGKGWKKGGESVFFPRSPKDRESPFFLPSHPPVFGYLEVGGGKASESRNGNVPDVPPSLLNSRLSPGDQRAGFWCSGSPAPSCAPDQGAGALDALQDPLGRGGGGGWHRVSPF